MSVCIVVQSPEREAAMAGYGRQYPNQSRMCRFFATQPTQPRDKEEEGASGGKATVDR